MPNPLSGLPTFSRSSHDSHNLYAQSPGNSSTHLTPSDNDDEESDREPPLPINPEAFELQPIPPINDVTRRSDALSLPMLGSRGDEGSGLLSRRLSVSSTESYQLYTPDEDKKVLHKLDRKLVGFMALLYCLSFLDRSSEWQVSFVLDTK